ncbi:MAG: phosphatase [Actinomycetota bacterium]|nr:phosphatase [Actinomycetota bacterium]
MSGSSLSQTREALVAAGITGPHQSHARRGSILKIHALLEGDEEATFGLSGIDRYSAQEILGFMALFTGCPPDIADVDCEDWIDPDLTVQGIVNAGRRLSDAATAGATLLLATGHPTGMLEHHIRVADAYVEAGGKIVRPREEEVLPISKRERQVRYIGGVGCVADWGALLHTHSSAAMDALLDSKPWPDLVLGDHGFAGAAIERDIPTIAIMDINDHALAVAAATGKDVTIVPMDDNRTPYLYEPSWTLLRRLLAGEIV